MRKHDLKKGPMAEINVVPYIDVMLVLLVIFMVTAPMLTQGVDVELPRAATEPLPVDDQTENLIVSVTRDQTYFMELGEDNPQASSLQEVQAFVRNVLNENPQTSVLVRGDAQVPYGRVVDLMVALQQSGVANVGLVTEPL